MGAFAGNIERWLAVQYWEMYYDDESFESGDKYSQKKVTFKDEDEVQEIQAEHLREITKQKEDVAKRKKCSKHESRLQQER